MSSPELQHMLLTQNQSFNVTNKYQVISSENIIKYFQSQGWKISKFQVSKTRLLNKNGFQRHSIRLRNEKAFSYFNELGLFPEIIVHNSYDGTTALRIDFGLFRLVCSNGLVIKEDTDFQPLYIKHIGSHFFDKVESFLKQADDYFKKLHNVVDKSSTFILSKEEKLSFAQKALELRITPEKVVNFDDVLQVHRPEDDKDDLFTVFNVIQENVLNGNFSFHSTYKGKPIIRKAKGITNLHNDNFINSQLWKLYKEKFAISDTVLV